MINIGQCFNGTLFNTDQLLMDHSPFKLNLHLCKKAKSFTTARKGVLKLVKLPSLVAKYCKKRKIVRLRSLQILYIFVLRTEKPYHFQ